jgi:hypothetical protein
LELTTVRQRYGGEPAAVIAASLGRTAHSVHQKARQLGVAEAGAGVGSTDSRRPHAARWKRFSDVIKRSRLRALDPADQARLERLRSNPAFVGYFAGLLDGEGTITSGRAVTNQHLHVTNTSPEMLAWLVEHIGGTLYTRRLRAAHHKPSWVWNLQRTPYVIALLRLVLPLLTVKAQRARAAIDSYQEHWL